jgi:lysophospholipase L1-like esterase
MSDPSQIPVQPTAFRYGLPQTAQRLRGSGPLKIVAIGSSTTAGEGGIVAYPSRLEALLKERYPGLMIDVLNRGVGGEEAPQELARLEKDVFAEHPTLVIWQVGTNAVWQEPQTVEQAAEAIREGLRRMRAVPDMDVVLMDLQ